MSLLAILLLAPAVGSMAGCETSKEAIKPEQFAPPPSEADEKSEENAG